MVIEFFTYLEGLAQQSGWLAALLLKFVIIIALFGAARILAMAIYFLIPDCKLKKKLFSKVPD